MLADKDYTYLLNHLADFQDDLLTAKDDLLSPIKAFMHGPQRAAYDEAIAFLREEEANFPDISAEDVQPLRNLAAAEAPFRGNGVPAAKASVTKLRELIASLLNAERQVAMAALDENMAKLRALSDFQKLDEAAAAQVLIKTDEARAAICAARFVTAIRDRLNRYCTQDYPTQLALIARLAAPEPPAKPGAEAKPEPPAPTYVPATSLRVKCNLPYLGSEEDLDQWLAALRAVASQELKKGNRISL